MEEHLVIGERILAQVEGYNQVAEIVRHHHERVDGAGYPDRLRGDSIPARAHTCRRGRLQRDDVTATV
jgi:response regulator RpfG family c-di-GMP phosphodiesterase